MNIREWELMLARSFSPREWFQRDESDDVFVEEKIMWVYKRVDELQWQVGYYTPAKEWVLDSSHMSQEAAARRVHYLNGGNER